MTKKVIFASEEAIDIRAFTIFGINAKPKTDTPIGYFGTGLKYAVAVLLRLGAQLSVTINDTVYEFHVSKDEFRGQEFESITMRKHEGFLSKWVGTEKLPYTLQHGRNWEMWQAYRELESNTRDEGGITILIDGDIYNDLRKYKTLITVESDLFHTIAFENNVFLGSNRKLLETINGIEIYEGKSNCLYYRGIRVQDLEEESLFTYNFKKHTELTEDRTLAYFYYEKKEIASALTQTADRGIAHRVASATDCFESTLELDNLFSVPKPVYQNVIRSRKDKGLYITPRVATFIARQDELNKPKLTDYQRGWNDALEATKEKWESLYPDVREWCEESFQKPSKIDDTEIPF